MKESVNSNKPIMGTLSWGFAQKGFELSDQRLLLLKKRKFSHIEMRVMDVNLEGDLFNHQCASELGNTLAKAGLSLSLHSFSGVNLGEKVDRIRSTCVDIVVDQMLFGERAGAKWLTVHLGSGGFAYDAARKQRRLDFAIESIQQVLEQTAGSKICIAIENLHRLPLDRQKTYLGDRLGEFEYLMQRLPHPRVGILFDIGHAGLNPERPALEFLKALPTRILGVHVHQNDGERDLHQPLTEDWVTHQPVLLQHLLALGESGIPLILEHHKEPYILQSQATLNTHI